MSALDGKSIFTALDNMIRLVEEKRVQIPERIRLHPEDIAEMYRTSDPSTSRFIFPNEKHELHYRGIHLVSTSSVEPGHVGIGASPIRLRSLLPVKNFWERLDTLV